MKPPHLFFFSVVFDCGILWIIRTALYHIHTHQRTAKAEYEYPTSWAFVVMANIGISAIEKSNCAISVKKI